MERAQLESLVMATGCAEQHGGYTFLIDPHWTAVQREKFANIKQSQVGILISEIYQGLLCIPTGGSSGGLKFARHDEQTLSAAVGGFCEHFELEKVDAIDVLPPWHVSGLMSLVRCAATGGRYLAWQWKMLESGEWPELSGEEMLSLVPTQLQRLLAESRAVAWMQGLKLILIGGGPSWPSLEDAASAANLSVVFSYGITETAAMILAQTPDEFASGDRSSGRALPQARIDVCDAETGAVVGADQCGVIRITGSSVMRGYYGDDLSEGLFLTADLGRLDSSGHLQVEGRLDDVIITGGEKVSARSIESILRGCDGLYDVVVLGLPHEEWGEEVVTCYLSDHSHGEASLARWASANLTKHQCPKRFMRFSATEWPLNGQGKVNRAELRRLALSNPSRDI